jgi:hypothetical protein
MVRFIMLDLNTYIQRTQNLIVNIQKDPTLPDEIKSILSASIENIKAESTNNNKNASTLIDIVKKLEYEICHQTNISKNKIERIQKQLMRMQDSIQKSEIPLEKPNLQKADIAMAIFCDIDSPDHNGAINSFLQNAMDHKVPFITSKSTLLGLQRSNAREAINSYDNMETELWKNQKDWHVFQQIDAQGHEGLLVFLPRTQTNGLTDEEILKAFDLNSDGSLKKISFNQLVIPSKNKIGVDSILNLFSQEPKKTKLFALAGHGGIGKPGGFSVEHYKQFLRLAEQQKCRGLTLTSCYSGGESTLLHFDQKDQEKDSKTSTMVPKVKFPVIARSIGDFPTQSGHEAEKDISLYFKELNDLLSHPGGETAPQLGKMFKKVEQERGKYKTPVNLVQVYFPPSADSPGGFQTVGEGGKSYSLTFAKMRNEQILKSRVDGEGIKVTQCKFLELHPLVVELPLIWKGVNPIILSSIAGNAHHYIKELQIKDQNLEEFLNVNKTFYKDSEIGVQKGFIIEKLVTKDKIYNNVLVSINEFDFTCCYRENNKAYALICCFSARSGK